MIRVIPLLIFTSSLGAQTPADLSRERSDYLTWLTTAPNSPLAAVAQQAVGAGVRLGAGQTDIPLAGLAEHRVLPREGGFSLEGPAGVRPLPVNRPIPLGSYSLYLTRSARDAVLTVFGPTSARKPPGYFPYQSTLTFTGPLLPPKARGKTRVLGPDGIEVQATEAGTVLVPLAGGTRLRVLKIPSGEEEYDLEIFFRDDSNGHASYPAGRFVTLIPQRAGRYRLDFNRARNPFCAYNTVYPCPAPWPGNVLHATIEAGERYTGGGLELAPDRQEAH
jgi:Protein of unknown function (DUF1684)